MPADRFYVKAKSVNAVRRALGRAPGGVRVIGRFDRETIECRHTMQPHSLARHWPVVLSRLAQAGLVVVAKPEGSSPTHPRPQEPATDAETD
jgi:hypothetical protein